MLECRRGGEFVSLVKTMLASKGDHKQAATFAATTRTIPPAVAAILKDGLAGSLADPSWAAPLSEYRRVANGFLESLHTHSVFDRMWGDDTFLRVPLRTRVSVITAAARGSTVSEAALKPVTEIHFQNAVLNPQKATAIVVVSDELAKSMAPGADDFIGKELRKAVAAATDLEFLSSITNDSSVFRLALAVPMLKTS